MENANKTYDLKVEKTIPKAPSEVFRAIGEGRLFMNCSADAESLKIDFQVGGSYSIEFKNFNMKNCGEFLEIEQNRKIVFTWCQDYDSNPIPDTKVSVELKDLGGKTALTLIHEGFTDQDNRDGHQGGWNGGLDDLSLEIVEGKLRFMRKAPLSPEKLYALCKTGVLSGKILEEVPNKKMILSMDDTKATLGFDTDDDDQNASWLEVAHEGLNTEERQKSWRKKWDSWLNSLN